MPITAETVEADYHAAMSSLSPTQAEALAMLKRAHQFERMNNRTLQESLKLVFAEVAKHRNAVPVEEPAESLPHPASDS